MTPERMRVKIAEACGWSTKQTGGKWPRTIIIDSKGGRRNDFPNYHGDLNAMREALKTLTMSQQINFCYTLNEMNTVGEWDILMAPCDYLAAAFLHTLGLWEEGGEL